MKYRRWFRIRARTADELAREIEEELEAHVAMRSDDLRQQGKLPDRAREDAEARFGDYREARRLLIESARQRDQRRRRGEWLDTLRQDLSYAFRRARHSPAHSAFNIGVIAIGIALTTSVFTIVSAVLIHGLPFEDSKQLFALTTLDSVRNEVPTVSITDWADWKTQSRTMEHSALYRTYRTPVVTGPEAIRSTVTQTAGDFFNVLRSPMLHGRGYTDAETLEGVGGAVVSEGFWRSELGGRALPISITIGSWPREVVGVIRAGYEFPRGSEIWVGERYRVMPGMFRNFINYSAIARLKPDVSLQQADPELDAIASRITSQDPVALYSHGVTLTSLKQTIVGDAATYLPLLFGAVVCVLLLGCANLAGLNLARGRAREREVAVRAALGAGRARLLRQLLVEHVVLALVAGAAGLLLARLLVNAAIVNAGSVLPRADEITMQPSIVVFALAISITCGVLTGILPALQLSRSALRDRLGARGHVLGGKQLSGALLVAVEIAASVVLLTGGLLLLRSYRALLDRDLGYDPNVIAADVVLSRGGYPEPAQWLAYWQRLSTELRTLPEVEAVGLANWIPMGGGAVTFVEVEGNSAPNNGAGYRVVGDDYFRALGVPMVAGRAIEPRDDANAPRVAVINRTMAERFWPGQNPIGRRVRLPVTEVAADGSVPWLTVVGIVGDVRHWGIDTDVGPELYTSYRQVAPYAMSAIIRTRQPASIAVATAQERIRQIDPQTPADLGTLQQRLDDSLRVRHLITTVLSIFGVLALTLAAMGLYSLLAFAVAQRSREIAVRLALGARQNNLIGLVFGNAMAIALVGVVAGLLLSFALMRFVTAMLVEVTPLDPFTLATVPLVLIAATALAALLPAVRAARVSPMTALNRE